MAYIISVANQKGGVAKTTTTHNIGAELASNGYKVLLAENDSQGSLTISLGLEPLDFFGQSICEVYDGSLPIQECIHVVKENLHLLPANIDLSTLELALFKKYIQDSGNSSTPNGWTEILSKMLDPVKDFYDYIVIDCPPALSVLTLNALTASNGVVVPCKTDYLSYRGLTHLDDTISQIQEYTRPDLKIIGVIGTLFDIRLKDDKEILLELKKRSDYMGVIKNQAAAKKGIYDGLSVVEREPYSEVAIAYRNIVNKIIKATQTKVGE